MKRFLLLVSLGTILCSQSVSLSAYVEKKTVPDNELFKLYLEFSWFGSASDFRIELNSLPHVSGLELLGSGSRNSVSDENGKSIIKRTYFYNLKALRRGKVSIAAISARAIAKNGSAIDLESEEIELTVVKGEEPFELSTKLISILLGALVVLALIIIVVLQRAKKQKKKLESFVTDDSYAEYKIKKELSRIKNEPERLEESSKTFFKLIESYFEEAHINKHSILIDESKKLSFEISDFLDRINEMRFSGLVPDLYELENNIMKFKEILETNLNTRKERSTEE